MAETPPSTEFSIGTRAAATSPARTACSAWPPVAYAIGSPPVAGRVSRAGSEAGASPPSGIVVSGPERRTAGLPNRSAISPRSESAG